MRVVTLYQVVRYSSAAAPAALFTILAPVVTCPGRSCLLIAWHLPADGTGCDKAVHFTRCVANLR